MSDIQHAEIVIIGGGVIGCSIAYHLTKMGHKDVLLLEREQLTHGTTWHAAGLVGQLRSTRNKTKLMQQSVALYDQLEAETGQPVDWKKVGSLRLACSEARMHEIRRSATGIVESGSITPRVTACQISPGRRPCMPSVLGKRQHVGTDLV